MPWAGRGPAGIEGPEPSPALNWSLWFWKYRPCPHRLQLRYHKCQDQGSKDGARTPAGCRAEGCHAHVEGGVMTVSTVGDVSLRGQVGQAGPSGCEVEGAPGRRAAGGQVQPQSRLSPLESRGGASGVAEPLTHARLGVKRGAGRSVGSRACGRRVKTDLMWQRKDVPTGRGATVEASASPGDPAKGASGLGPSLAARPD